MSTTTSTTNAPTPVRHTSTLPPLEPGDRLDQKTFHARYRRMPSDVKAELIEGTVYMPSPLKFPHAQAQENIVAWIWHYRQKTPGIVSGDNGTVILGDESEPQPDALAMIQGGGARVNDDEYFEGSPELVVEIASSSESIDLHGKRRDYEKHGVQEYLVIALRQQRAYWFARIDEAYEEILPGDDGIYRSRVLPGLWLDPQAILNDDGTRLIEVLQQGLASDEHAGFVKKLQQEK